MAYILGQFNHKQDGNSTIKCMTSIGGATASYVKPETTEEGSNNLQQYGDVELKFDNFLINGVTYYCHCKIKKISTEQNFTIRLKTTDTSELNKEQFIKNIKIFDNNANNDWVDVQFTFTAQDSVFNIIAFNLLRTSIDSGNERKPFIVFLEFCEVNNIIKTILNKESNLPLIKMGIQSRPGLKMIINQEEIFIGRTGVYEIKNGEVKIGFLSFVNFAIDKTTEELDEMVKDEDGQRVVSIISNNKEIDESRTFESFTLDYIYEE